MYDSAMQQQNFGNRNAETTAYAAGQGERAKQEGIGAGLLTPNLTGYGSMANEQNAQQSAGNKQTADIAGIANKAFDVWSTPDKASKDAAVYS
jgi:hypothetical protein